MTALQNCQDTLVVMHHQMAEQDTRMVQLQVMNKLLWELVEDYGEEHDRQSYSYQGCECDICVIRNKLAATVPTGLVHSVSG